MNQQISDDISTGTRIWRTGSGPKLILLHGEFGDAPSYWGPIFETMASHFDVILPDLPGFGESPSLPDDRLQTFLLWLKQLTDAVVAKEPSAPEPIVLGGAGFGATLARLFAARYRNRVSRLILTGGGTVDRSSRLRGLVARLVGGPRVAGPAVNPRSPIDLFYDPESHRDSEIWHSFDQSRSTAARVLRTRDESPLPPDLSPVCPTLLLWGNEDRYCPLTVEQAIATELKDARQVEIYEAGHLVMIEQPDRFSAHLLDFVGMLRAEGQHGGNSPDR